MPAMEPPYPLVLVDASSYLFRAYHALPKLTNSKGEATGALIGVLNMLRKLREDYRPEFLAVIFDAPGKTFRDDIFPAYKGHRPAMPDDLREQIEPLYAIIQAMGLPLLRVPEVEADDVIGTLATRAAAQGLATLISTGDKDLAQLVGDHVTLINTMSDERLDRQGVIDKFGVPPERIVDYLTLVGDSVDNIPGVPNCGPKTAVKWLQEFGDLEGVMAHAAQVKGKVGDNLRQSLDRLPLSRSLAQIKLDLDLGLAWGDLKPTAPDPEALRAWFRRIESRRLLESLDGKEGARGAPAEAAATGPAGAASQPDPVVAYEILTDPAHFDTWLARLAAAKLFVIDTETTSLDYIQARIVGISFAVEAGAAAYVPLAHTYVGAPPQLDREAVLARLKPLLEDPARPKVGQNLKYDMSVLANHGIGLQGIAHDTMLESYVLDSTASRHDMDSLALKYLGHKTIHFEDIAGKGAKQLGFDQVPIEAAGPYAAEDAEVTLRLHQTFWPRLEQQPGLARLYQEIEMPLVPVLSRLERQGVRIDRERLAAQSRDLTGRIAALEEAAYRVAGRPFNLGSPKQIGDIFFTEQGLPVVEKTPKGAPSTSESVLQQLADAGHELPRIILEHRGLAKLKSTYTDKLPQMVSPVTGRVHTSYHQAVAATGAPLVLGPQSAEHPHPQRGRAAHPSGLHRRSGLQAGRRRLFPDRAAHHGPPLRGRAPAGCLCRRSGHPWRHRRRGLGPGPGPGQRRSAPCRQGHQFRAHLWHVGLRPGAATGDRARRGPGLRGPLFPALHRGEGLYGPHPPAGASGQVCRDPVRAAPLPAGHRPLQPGTPRRFRAHRHQCPPAGYGRRHHQAGHDCRR
jgi:DNA polymerase-1